MSLKSFLQEKGFIEKEPVKQEAGINTGNEQSAAPQATPESVPPTYFPIHSQDNPLTNTPRTSYIPPPETTRTTTAPSSATKIDDAFIKFYEDELVKANLPGPDYFEFRKQMQTMHQKMANKGASDEVILQAVLTSFEAQNVPPSKLVEDARHYKEVLGNKKDDFLKGANAEKDKQLQNRQNALQTHQANLADMQNQLVQLQKQMEQLQNGIRKEQTQMEVDRTLGKEGIEKIEKAVSQITLAHDYMIAAIDKDIRQLQSS
jgi:hypothetical protein